MSRTGLLVTERLGVGDGFAPLQLLRRGGRSRTMLSIAIGGRDMVGITFTAQFGVTIAGVWKGERERRLRLSGASCRKAVRREKVKWDWVDDVRQVSGFPVGGSWKMSISPFPPVRHEGGTCRGKAVVASLERRCVVENVVEGTRPGWEPL